MITADDLIGESAAAALADGLQDLADALIDVLLTIISGFFEFFFTWLTAVLTGGILGDRPAIILIALAFFITALIVWRGKQ